MGDMAFVDLRSGISREIHFKDFTKTETELQDFELTTIKWLSPSTFQLRLDVRCNPYELGDEECDYAEIVRRYVASVALEPLKIDYK